MFNIFRWIQSSDFGENSPLEAQTLLYFGSRQERRDGKLVNTVASQRKRLEISGSALQNPPKQALFTELGERARRSVTFLRCRLTT